ncbi:MAG TPA: DUF4412 domain-containing protein [Cytophagaceae bacterium]|jgi:hypothetical protein|nr:DUF4412 domain-containing protein [Cytophagaceae bacterium]
MKKNILVFIAMCFAIAVNAQNGAYIEYKIGSSKGAKGTAKLNFSEFGSISEFNIILPQMPGEGMVNKSLSQKSNPDVVYNINDKNKTYSETKKATTSSDDSKNYVVTRKGEEILNGYKCVHAIITDGIESYEVWNTKDIPDYNKYSEMFKNNKRLGSAKKEQALKAAGCDGLPVKTIHKGNEKEGEMTMELVKVEKKNFTKSDFEIPVGYTKSESVSPTGRPQIKSQEEIMKMTPGERAKYIEEMKKQYGK